MDSKCQARNALLWLQKSRTSAVKQQSYYLGSPKIGYNLFGYGCKLFGLEYYPDVKTSKEFADLVGLRDEIGSFEGTIMVENGKKFKMYANLQHMNREFTFRRIAAILMKTKHARRWLQPAVAEEYIQLLKNKKVKV